MNFQDYFCNLKQAYLVITNTSTISRINKRGPSSLDEEGLFYLQLWMDRTNDLASLASTKRVYITTIYQVNRKWLAVSDIDVGLAGNFRSPFVSIYKYNKNTEKLSVGYGVEL